MTEKQLYTITSIQTNPNGNIYGQVLGNFSYLDQAMKFYKRYIADRCALGSICIELSPRESEIRHEYSNVVEIIKIHRCLYRYDDDHRDSEQKLHNKES